MQVSIGTTLMVSFHLKVVTYLPLIVVKHLLISNCKDAHGSMQQPQLSWQLIRLLHLAHYNQWKNQRLFTKMNPDRDWFHYDQDI